MNDLAKIFQILDSGSIEEKIDVLESFNQSNKPEIIKKIISMLGDPEIRVRGEAFNSLLFNKNNISEFLIQSITLDNNKAFSALVLANRGDTNAIPTLELLTTDNNSMVRSCALGALGYLNSIQSSTKIRNCFKDEVLEVRKSALQAFLNIHGKIFSSEIRELSEDADDELRFLIRKIPKNSNGPGGI